MRNLAGVLPVAFTGAPGAYSEEAARRFFGRGASTLTCNSASEALASVRDGRAASAVFPVENTVTGGYDGVPEALTQSDEAAVVGEIVLPIRHCLLAVPGARLSQLTEVLSHRSALIHCRDWLANWGVATREAPDTARAARELSERQDRVLGVLGSRTLAELYQLDILAEGLSDHSHNETRFWVSEAGATPHDEGTRSAMLVGPVTAPRALKTLRMQLEARGSVRTRAPFLCSADARFFLVEFDHRPGEGPELAAGACEGLPFRLLGCWQPAG